MNRARARGPAATGRGRARVRGRLKEAWGDLTDDDVDRAEGKWDQMVATIRAKTGESLDTVSSKINDMIDSLRNAGSSD